MTTIDVGEIQNQDREEVYLDITRTHTNDTSQKMWAMNGITRNNHTKNSSFNL